MVKHLLFMSQVSSILAEVTHFNFVDTGTPEEGFLGSDGYLGKVGLIARCLVVNLDEWFLEGQGCILQYNYMTLTNVLTHGQVF